MTEQSRVGQDKASENTTSEDTASENTASENAELSEKLTKVAIHEFASDALKRSVDALINDKGDFVLDGYDLGKFVEEHLSGDDYEYSITVEAGWKDTLLLLLIKNQFSDFPEFERWIKSQGIPHLQFRWS